MRLGKCDGRHNSIHDVQSGLKIDRLLSVWPLGTYSCMHGTEVHYIHYIKAANTGHGTPHTYLHSGFCTP